MRLLLALLLPSLAATKNIFVSSPFDNFRIECPKKSGATELSVRMVESVGAKRQDIVFDMSCESIEEIYPWVNIPVGISDMEREDCYYSSMFDPILDEDTDYSCKNREYFAGITRLTDTRVQVLCCRLRSRAEFNCRETQFNKPIGLSRSTIIEGDNQLINAIRVNDRGYIVRFCDLAPRNIPEIYDDVKVTTVRPHTTPKENLKGKVQKVPVNPYSTRPPQFSSKARLPAQIPELPTVDAFGQRIPEYSPTKTPLLARLNEPSTTLAPTTQPTTSTTTTTRTTTTAAPTTASTPPSTTTKKATTTMTTTTTTTTPLPTTTRKVTTTTKTTTTATTTEAPTTTTTTASQEEERNAVEDSMEQVEAEVPPEEQAAPEATTQAPAQTKSVEDITMIEDLSRVTFNNDDFPKANEKKLAVPGKMKFSKNQLPLRPGAANNEFVFLPSINHEGVRRAPVRTYRPHINLWDDEDEMEEMYGPMGFTSSERKMHRKVTRAHRLPPPESKEQDGSSMSDVSKEALYQNMMKNAIPDRETLYLKEDARKLPPGARQDLPAIRRNPDEETRNSPFEDGKEEPRRTTSVYVGADEIQQAEDIEEVISRLALHPENIRRAPVRNTEPAETQSEKRDRTKMKDGVKSHRTKGVESPISVNELVIFDAKYKERKVHPPAREALVPMMSPQFFGEEMTMPETHVASSATTEVELETTAAPTSSTTTEPSTTEYDPTNFYHTPRPKPPKREKVLTFCTKDIAIRDERNMVIACGGELDVWVPNRCPKGTYCFISSDSTYRICCPISKG